MVDLLWGASEVYPGRVHLVPDREPYALCSTRLLHVPLLIAQRWTRRPAGLVVCPECAIAHLITAYPAQP